MQLIIWKIRVTQTHYQQFCPNSFEWKKKKPKQNKQSKQKAGDTIMIMVDGVSLFIIYFCFYVIEFLRD